MCPSDEVLRRLEERHPVFVRDAEAKGVKYTAYMAATNDTTMGAGRSWKSFFGRDTREAVETRMRELGYTWEWLPEETLCCTSPVLPAVRTAPGTDRRVFFNQLVAQIANATDFHERSGATGRVEDVLDKYMTFGDGSSMDAKVREREIGLGVSHSLALSCFLAFVRRPPFRPCVVRFHGSPRRFVFVCKMKKSQGRERIGGNGE